MLCVCCSSKSDAESERERKKERNEFTDLCVDIIKEHLIRDLTLDSHVLTAGDVRRVFVSVVLLSFEGFLTSGIR